jgi:RimJ/RimL family protein N-acetyltransferase
MAIRARVDHARAGRHGCDNTAMRRAFERLGFACEGIMRVFIAAHAGREDCALYALTKDTWHGRVTEQ